MRTPLDWLRLFGRFTKIASHNGMVASLLKQISDHTNQIKGLGYTIANASGNITQGQELAALLRARGDALKAIQRGDTPGFLRANNAAEIIANAKDLQPRIIKGSVTAPRIFPQKRMYLSEGVKYPYGHGQEYIVSGHELKDIHGIEEPLLSYFKNPDEMTRVARERLLQMKKGPARGEPFVRLCDEVLNEDIRHKDLLFPHVTSALSVDHPGLLVRYNPSNNRVINTTTHSNIDVLTNERQMYEALPKEYDDVKRMFRQHRMTTGEQGYMNGYVGRYLNDVGKLHDDEVKEIISNKGKTISLPDGSKIEPFWKE